MRASRLRKLDVLSEITVAYGDRDPLDDPLYGDIVEGMDGERRFVEIRPRGRARGVHYRCAGNSTPGLSLLPIECSISDWRRWARGGKVLCTTPVRTRFDSISRRAVFASATSADAAL